MKFLIEACLTLPPKFRAQDFSLSFHRGCLFRSRITLLPWKSFRDSSSENLNMSKSSKVQALGTTALNFLGPFMPKKLLQYSIQAMLTLNLDLSYSLFGCIPLSQSWQTDPAALPLNLPRYAGLFLSISLVRLMQQLQPMHPRWFSQKKMGLWSYPITWQYSVKPLWQRLKQTKECWPGSRGVQITILRSYLLPPVLLICECMATQLLSLQSYFLATSSLIFCASNLARCSYFLSYSYLLFYPSSFSGEGSYISSSSSSSPWQLDQAVGFLMCYSSWWFASYYQESNFLISLLPRSLLRCLRAAFYAYFLARSASFCCNSEPSRVLSSSKSMKALWLALLASPSSSTFCCN